MKKPNFFVIGAPKCGTTSLMRWLQAHPQIFTSKIKEPHYFNTDDPGARRMDSLSEYESLYSEATDAHKAVGEGSTLYLYSTTAVSEILKYNPEARLIACLRNPVKMAQSLHVERYTSLTEDVEDFQKAWQLQDQRRNGKLVPKLCRAPRNLLYGEQCKLGEQLERVYSHVPRERVLPILLEDIQLDAKKEFKKTLAFLGVNDPGEYNLGYWNPAKTYRSRKVAEYLRGTKRFRHQLVTKKVPGRGVILGFLRGLTLLNTRPLKKEKLQEDFKQELVGYFRDDIKQLEKLLQRDLNDWLK